MFYSKAGVACGVGGVTVGAMARLLPTVASGRRGATTAALTGCSDQLAPLGSRGPEDELCGRWEGRQHDGKSSHRNARGVARGER